MSDATPRLTEDEFLGGRLVLRQPATGYRAGVDPVILAASVAAQPGESILDLGCGVGAASLCLGARVTGLKLVGLERQAIYADLARQNATANNIDLTVTQGDLEQMPDALRAETFDHVIMNPPYFLRTRGTASPNDIREGALGEDTPLAIWMDEATKRLKPRGYVTMIQHVERLPEILSVMDGRLGSVVVKPLCPRKRREASLVLVHARKGGRGAFRLAAPLIMHDGEVHESDRADYTPEVAAILREGIALPFW